FPYEVPELWILAAVRIADLVDRIDPVSQVRFEDLHGPADFVGGGIPVDLHKPCELFVPRGMVHYLEAQVEKPVELIPDILRLDEGNMLESDAERCVQLEIGMGFGEIYHYPYR